MLFPRVLLLLLASATTIVCLATLASGDAVLAADEKDALEQIAGTLGKTDWDFSVDPCSGQNNWNSSNANKDNMNAVSCDCSFNNNSTCHVVSIVLKVQNLSGTLPPQLTKLSFLREIDLTRNYLNGSIPFEWGSMKLVNISLLGNRISGQIPKELGNISTLGTLVLEHNQLNGTIPPELGNLTSLEKLTLSSNYLTGELPRQLSKLTNLTDFRISDNQFVGTIPNFIENWTQLQNLMIQASGLNGPIPDAIASLTNLVDLRISDLHGNDSRFPSLSEAKNLKNIILRNCNITGQLPDYLGSVTTWQKSLKILDLSFNKLTGPIPKNYDGLWDIDFIYLTGNFLSEEVPDWILNKGQNMNLFSSSSNGNTSGIVSCLRNNKCSGSVYSLHINCGGREVRLDNGTIYEDDMESGGSSKFIRSRSNWAFSSTGHILDNDLSIDTYIRDNSSIAVAGTGNNLELYKNARLSPLSLTYYAFCLVNGNYTVNLHFAEIMFTDDKTYASLGRRFFDIYIQRKLVWKDFNIEDRAGGVGKPIFIPFHAEVNDNTLEIRFFWAGKGTTAIPFRAVYGPLISAISVTSDSPPVGNSLSAGAVVGIVFAVLFVISGVLVILWWKGCLPCKDSLENDLRGLELHTGTFTLRQIKAATNNFDAANKIGEGGFGSVYKGHLRDGTIIAVKQLSSKSKQGNREFVNEIGMISALQHPNLVKLYGCCIEGNQLLLIYEYMENNSLARALFGPEEQQLELDWPTRHKIAIGIARGLAYLHEESRLKIVHRDIKATNVLLDKNLNPKISDFGLAKLDEEGNTHISTRVTGTFGYMAPEYAMRGYLTDKADVYSFGVVLLEIVSGKSNTSIKPKQDLFYLLDWANQLKKEGKLTELIDPRLGSKYNKEEIMLTLQIGLLCTNATATERPNMSSVVSMLEGTGVDKSSVSDHQLSSSSSSKNSKFKALEITNEEHQKVAYSNESLVEHVSMDVPFTASSTSSSDLYPINLESDYLLRRP